MLKKSFSSYYLLCPLIVLSLYVENAYFNIMEAKFKAFAVIFFINLIPAAVILAVHMIRRLRRGIPSPGLGDVSIGIFTAVTLISCLSSAVLQRA